MRDAEVRDKSAKRAVLLRSCTTHEVITLPGVIDGPR